MASDNKLSDNIPSAGSNTFYTEAFHSTLEHHIRYLITSSGAMPMTVDDGVANARVGDFFGLCGDLKIPPAYHWITMRCNGLMSPWDYTVDMVNLVVPSFDEVNELHAIYNTSGGISLG